MSHRTSPSKSSSQPLPVTPEALRRHLEVLRSAFDALDHGMLVLDRHGRVLLFNATAARLLPIASDGPLPKDLLPFRRVLAGESIPRIDLPGVNAGVLGRPLRDAQGVVQGALFVLEGPARPEVERLLRNDSGLAAAVVETAATLVTVLDREARIVAFNRACEQATGWSFEELRGKPIWDILLAPEDIASIKEVFEDLRAGRFPNRHENAWLARDGSRRVISWSNTALLDDRGEVEHIVATGIDITERKRTEDELRQANDTLRAVIEASPLAIIGMDLRGRVKGWNHAAERMFGFCEAEVLGEILPVVPEEDRQYLRDNLARARTGETLSGVERQLRRKDGSLLDAAIWTAPQRESTGMIVGVIAVIADITERKRLEEQFLQSQKMEAVGRLAGGVAHDFNNLLTVITGYTQMMADLLPPDDPMRETLDEVLRASDSAAALTGQLLAFSRRQIIQPQVLDLNALVVSLDKMLHRLIGEDVELVTQLAPRLPRVKVDPGQFQQVLMNLVVNARDAMPEGGRLTIETASVELPSGSAAAPPGMAPGAYVCLSVVDTGRGMEPETQRRLFEPFFTTKARGKGTGLGLSTAYGIVKQAGGEIWAESEPGRGTAFRICLPAIEEAAAAGVRGAGGLARQQGTETILVVEDEPGLRRLIREVLHANGYLVLEAGDVREALRLAEEHLGPIHLFLSDVVMPRMSGREVADRFRERRPDVKLLFMSGYTDHAALEHGFLDAGVPFLQKPFSPETLLARVREALDAAAPPPQ